jgi:hypothetical protein
MGDATSAIAARTAMALEKKAMFALPEINGSANIYAANAIVALPAEGGTAQGGAAEFFVRLYSFFFGWIK